MSLSDKPIVGITVNQLSGFRLLTDPLLNKGTAFTEEERDLFELHGLLPPSIGTLDEQIARRLEVLRSFETDIERYAFLRDLQDTNETLFYALLIRHLEEFLPIVYTPTVGQGCQQFSHLYKKPRGLFLSLANKGRIASILANDRFDGVEAIVVTDGERILGLGDQGAGGMGIPIGKLSLYVACGGLHPATTLPIVLDLGTDNQERLEDPLYLGWRHARVRGTEYDDFIEEFVTAVSERWPHVLLQWEDFAKGNANRLLERYRDRLCTFNDDIQGTAAVATGTLLAAVAVTGSPLIKQKIVVLGAGSAGCGIADLICRSMIEAGLPEDQARRQFYLVDRNGLLLQGMEDLASFQVPFAQPANAIENWSNDRNNPIGLLEVIKNVKPNVLIGVSGQFGAFDKAVVEAMSAASERPIIFPLSNPTSRAEATPQDIEKWSQGKAIVGTGSPFPAIVRQGIARKVDQTNNSYIFPGVGLGTIAVKSRRVSDGMMMAAAKALASMSPSALDPKDNLLPPVTKLREASIAVAQAVARQAVAEGLAQHLDDEAIRRKIGELIWTPAYVTYTREIQALVGGAGQ